MAGVVSLAAYTPIMPAPGFTTYKEMVEYVSSIVDPVRRHMEAHDVWHRDLAERDAARTRRDLWTSVGLILTFVVGAVDVIIRITGR